MRLPEIQLDDRRFQDLVSEARMRITQSCPEWTEHNVSDPGITLIELFAWMTEMTIYRLNRIPDKLHVALLDLIGIRLDPPSPAQAGVRLRLAEEATKAVLIPGGETAVGTPRTAEEDAIVFEVDEDFTIPPVRASAYLLQAGGKARDVGVADGVARPQGADQMAFSSPPAVGDALYVGFDEPIGRLVMAIAVDASQARGAGVDPTDPPLRWEVSQGDGEWADAEVLDDTTGGFNYGAGTVELQLPPRSAIQPLAGQRLHWVRCRVDDRTRGGAATSYSHPPEIYSITAAPVGALLPASHATRVENEILGVSDGTPGQVLPLRYAPVLGLVPGEMLEVSDPETGAWTAWEPRSGFVGSTEADHHFVVDPVSGEIELGPAIRQRDGGWSQVGAVPPKGAILRFTRYRHGGGSRGNVAAGTLRVLKTPIPGVDTVTNPAAAFGGVDAEPLERARRRAAMEIRSRDRAVTAEDFEFLAGEASPRIARSVCLPPVDGGSIHVHLVPQIFPADRRLAPEELIPSDELFAEVAGYLDERRLIGTRVHLLPCRFRGLSVVVNLQAAPYSDTGRIEEDVAHALYTFLNPIVGGDPAGPSTGWAFGRALNVGELYGVVHSVDGVEYVKVLRVYETDLATGTQSSEPTGSHVLLEPDELIASGQHIIKATQRE